MRHRLILCITFIIAALFLYTALPVYSQSAPGNVQPTNPPAAQSISAAPEPNTSNDNECYTGGTMAGKCDNGFHADGSATGAEVEWAWKCGWYMARFNDGTLTREQVPDECGILLPGIPVVPRLIPTSLAPTAIVPTATPATFCGVFFGGGYTICLTGIFITQDAGNDGSFEESWYIIADNVAGDGGLCPAGTTYSGSEVGNYTLSEANFYNFLVTKGFKDTDDFCSLP